MKVKVILINDDEEEEKIEESEERSVSEAEILFDWLAAELNRMEIGIDKYAYQAS